MRTRSVRPGLGRLRALCIAFVFLFLGLVGAGCDKVPLLAPTQSTITLSAAHLTLPLNGSTEITATVIEQSGTPVHNGTVVTFTATLGTIEPREARTDGGKVVVRFLAGGQSGTARIGAFSGPARATEIEIKIGAAAAERITLSATPATVSSRGDVVTVLAIVTDGAGNGLPGVPVKFAASAGTLTPTTATTDATGEARTELATDRETTVTATVGSQQAQVTVRVSRVPGISLAVSGTPTAGQPTTFTVTVTPGDSAVRDVTVNFGDGTTQSLGVVTTSASTTHTYRSAGTFVATATVTDQTGERTSASTTVTVAPPTPISVILTASSTTPSVNTPVTFTATVQPATLAVERYAWDWGDGSTTETSGNQTTHVYTAAGVRTIKVTVSAVDGRTAQTSMEIRVQ